MTIENGVNSGVPIGFSFPKLSSDVKSSLSWISSNLPEITVNSVAVSLVGGAIAGGARYTYLNDHPQNPGVPDFEGGVGIAMGFTVMIAGVTAAVQYLRGKEKDAGKWIAVLACGALGIHAAETHFPTNERYFEDCNDDPISTVKEHRIDCSRFELAKIQIDNNYFLSSPQAANGHTPTYLLSEHGLVLKKDGWKRAEQMEKAARLCKLNNYQHIAIAKVSTYKKIVVESMLPISGGEFFEKRQIGLYLNNYAAFTPVIREITGMLCQSTHDDLNSHKGISVLMRFGKDHVPRFDNMYLYLEGEVGKIAIPDLDSFQLGAPETPTIDDVIRFFPHHFDEILEEARKYYPSLSCVDPHLVKIREDALILYSNVYEKHQKHLSWIRPTIFQPDYFPEISEETINIIINNAIQRTFENGNAYLDSCKIPREELLLLSIRALKETQSVEKVRNFIAGKLKEKSCQHVSSEESLLMFRTIGTEPSFEIVRDLMIKFRSLNSHMKTEIFLENLIKSVFEEFVNQGLIATFSRDENGDVLFV